MKNLTRIADRLYNRPWLILPASHKQLRLSFENYLQGNQPLAEDVERDGHVQLLKNNNGMVIMSMYGTLGAKLSGLELMCGGLSTDQFTRDVKTLGADPSISTIVLDFHSPGGEVTGILEAGEAIAEIAKTKTIIAYTSGLMCSAAYWLASQCSVIYGSPSATIGSVGVYTLLLDATENYKSNGLKIYPVYNGKHKLDGADFMDYTAEERTAILTQTQAGVDKIATQFRNAVNANRNIKDEYLEGQVYDGEESVEYNFIDGIYNDLDELIADLGDFATIE